MAWQALGTQLLFDSVQASVVRIIDGYPDRWSVAKAQVVQWECSSIAPQWRSNGVLVDADKCNGEGIVTYSITAPDVDGVIHP